MTELALIYQCLFCGAYHIQTVDKLPNDWSNVPFAKLKKQQHELESEYMRQVWSSKARRQRPRSNAGGSADGTAGGSADGTAGGSADDSDDGTAREPPPPDTSTSSCSPHHPILAVADIQCSSCIEWKEGRKYDELLHRKEFLERPAGLSPALPVSFEWEEEDRIPLGGGGGEEEQKQVPTPAVYASIAGKWQLREGVGPKILETSGDVPFRLPAGQFRVLLPGGVLPDLPDCRAKLVEKSKQDRGTRGGGGGRKDGAKVGGVAVEKMEESAIKAFLEWYWEYEGAESLAERGRSFFGGRFSDRELLKGLLSQGGRGEEGLPVFVQTPLFCQASVAEGLQMG